MIKDGKCPFCNNTLGKKIDRHIKKAHPDIPELSGISSAFRLTGDIDTLKKKGVCGWCNTDSEVVYAQVACGFLALCNRCLGMSILKSMSSTHIQSSRPESKWESQDVLDHRMPGSPGTGKRR